MVEIAPSLLGAYDKHYKKYWKNEKKLDAKLTEEIVKAVNAGVERLEVDLMDGKFVPRRHESKPSIFRIYHLTAEKNVLIDVHYMGHIDEKVIDETVKERESMMVNSFSFHYEATPDPRRIAMHVKERGMKASIALNPWTPVSVLEDALEEDLVDEVLVMSVCPGKGGQKFREKTYGKISSLKLPIKLRKLNIKIKVDGGVNEENAQNLYKSGADILVIGSAFFNSGDYKKFVERIKGSCEP